MENNDKKILWYHPESDSYLLETEESMRKAMETDCNAALCEDVSSETDHVTIAIMRGVYDEGKLNEM